MTDPITYRPIRGADTPLYHPLRIEAVTRYPYAFGTTPEEEHARDHATVAARLESLYTEGSFLLGAFDGAQLVGMAGMRRNHGSKEAHIGYVFSVYVAETHRRRGIARDILLELIQRAEAIGIELLELHVAVQNTSALALYASLGFVVAGLHPNTFKLAENEYVSNYSMYRLREFGE
jgi:ribosomal protein S18 acetylase RimI-like enzyme